ncbi:MAG TPA: linear amide C-N hydrolase [Thermoanaerobaculia bacterium]|nr:linear amide C-N hydrolase [Thermoanaerobaculia bacterium]
MCTDLVIVSKDETGQRLVVNARSQEDDNPLGYRVMLRKKGQKVVVTMPRQVGDTQSLTNPVEADLGTAKHNYMGLIITNRKGIPVSTAVFDGMNDAGLSAGSLLFPGAVYPQEEQGADNIFVGFFVDWLLNNFETCAAVKEAIEQKRLQVVATNPGKIPEGTVNEKLGQHIAVHDAGGNSLAIEFIEGKIHVSDNPVGVLTNLPSLPWHLTNVGLYANLSNTDTKEVVFGKANQQDQTGELLYKAPGSPSPTPPLAPYRSTGVPGRGNGMTGLPGDYRPASRFVRTAYLKHFAVPPATAQEAVTQGFHLLNAIDIVKGVVAEEEKERASATTGYLMATDLKDEQPQKYHYDTTQFIVVKDVIHGDLYVRMYESPMPYRINFADFPASIGANGVQITIPVDTLARSLVAEAEPALV